MQVPTGTELDNYLNFILCFKNLGGKNLCFYNSVTTKNYCYNCLREIIKEKKELFNPENNIYKKLDKLTTLSAYETSSTSQLRDALKQECYDAGQVSRSFDDYQQQYAEEFLNSLIEQISKRTQTELWDKKKLCWSRKRFWA